MKKVQIRENEITFYSSAEEMPIRRYQRFNKFLMMDNEIGSDFEDFNKRGAKAVSLLKNKMIDEAVIELENRRMMVYNAFMEYSPQGRALAILVYSINGKVIENYTSDILDDVLKELDEIGFTKSQSETTTDEVKKKSKKNYQFISRVNSKTRQLWNTTVSGLKRCKLNCKKLLKVRK